MSRYSILLLIALFIPLFEAGACTCKQFRSAAHQLESADYAFVGTALTTVEVKPTRTIWDRLRRSKTPSSQARGITNFDVERVLKGKYQTSVAVEHSLYTSFCGLVFEANTSYIVFTTVDPDGHHYTGSCLSPMFEEEEYPQGNSAREQ